MKAKTTKKKPRRVYIYKNGNIENIREDMITFRRELEKDKTKSADEKYNKFVEIIRASTEKHIPHKTLSGRWDALWVNRNIKRLIRKKKRRYDKAKQSGRPEDWETFKEFRRFVKQELIKSHDEYIKGILDTDGKDNGSKFKISKKFWSYVRTKRRDTTGIPVLKVDGKEITAGREKAEALSKQYDSIFTNEDLTNIPCLLTPPAPRIKEITSDVNGVQKLLKNLDPKKANGPDKISTYILRECAEEIAPILTNIFTTSLTTGTTPLLWRTANIVAIFKKGSKMSTENYRPVSLTSVVCKILEHIIHRHIMNHCDQHNLLSSHQHGFRQKHSCESQLILSIEDIYRQHDKNKQVDMLILDFTKAFDTVPHQRLLMKLKHYGIDSDLHRWISSWLTERTQQVVVDGDYSTCKQVRSGVPQGTVLGPLMFLLYINDIGDNLNHSTIRLFADDCLLYKTISNQDDAGRLQDDLDKVQEWTDTWQMEFNAKKCYLLSMHSKRDPTLSKYRLKGEEIVKTSHHSYLGVEIQDDSKWSKHVENCTKKANRALGFIRRNFGRCPESIKETLYTAMVRPHLEYASGAWNPHLKKDINKLENIQRKASRFVKSCNCRDAGTVTGLLADLEWKSLKQRRTKHDLTLFYQAINGHIEIPLPPYVIPVKRNNKSHHEKGYIQMYAKNDPYKNSFIPRTIPIWNRLPLDTVNSRNTETFKLALSKLSSW